ncbi:MAG: hypothetical protein EZS28_000632 [Streblomastix strix]|uniref:Uncharacterized protein n=1 Tax=Streblomastix strix TaxID=222440 RepID=A0A5J4XBG5_9EUKA|nr:MAG: hypothetical protein EZS28_000632 [Streblomastix strix]
MFIKDIDQVVSGYLCKKCNQKLFNHSSAHFGRDLKTHLESCKGPDQQKHPKLDKLAQPLMPYLKSDKTIQKLFATGKTKLFPKNQEKGVNDILQPTKNFMCIDAETVEDQDQDDQQIYAQLLPLSIVIETGNKEYKFYSEKWNKIVEGCLQQDIKAGKDTTNNVTANDIDYFNQMISNKCSYCNAKFTKVNKPTLERINNNIALTKDNCKLACQLCNSTRSNKDANVAKLMIQKYKYASVKNLPMTIDDEEVYCVFCGIYNINNPYTRGKMYMAGRVTKHIQIREANDQDYRDSKRKEMMNIINSKDRFSEKKGQLLIASVKGHIDKNHIDEHINFSPIWRKRTYKTDEKTVGKFTYEKMQKQGISVNKQVTKLTSLLSTHDEFMSFSSYYLWLLIDYFLFIIDDVEEIVLFNKHTAFKSFVEVMAEKRQQAMREGNQAKQFYFKNIVNSSYGADGQNNEKFDKIGIYNKQQAYLKQLNKGFTNT